ncbi:MAG: cytochrome c biogenesis protein CcsA, partial [Chromatiales bacterium]|nr:cytochrome c biogenesis protein CcsA [Chromatiales bacterium]
MIEALNALSVTLYVAAACHLGGRLAHTSGPTQSLPKVTVALVGGALVFHALILYSIILTEGGINLGFFHAASLIAWVIAALAITAALFGPAGSLSVFVMPLAALTIVLSAVFPSHRDAALSTGVQVHITVSVIGYGTLTLAALQAALVWAQDRALRAKRLGRMLRALPPLTSQESLLFQLMGAGFFFLSLSLVSGIMFVDDLMRQHLAHKTAFSAAAWAVFAVLLWGRWRHGWRGRNIIRWTLIGFVALAL